MDYQSIINSAQQNISSSKEKGNFYKTQFAPPKKMTKEKRLSAGIQKFLEDKKREDEEKAERARLKKQELVSRRDPKVQRKIDKTLKVIKSSKKFYTGDSTLDENTAYTLANEQPDEDDYGYTSQVSDQFHKKLMEKYQKLPEDKKFSSGSGRHKAMSKDEIQSTKDRVKNALASKDEEPRFKQGAQHRTSKIKSEKEPKIIAGSTSTSSVPTEKKNFNKPKPKLKAAPIVDFQQLLKLAEQKQHEEITIEVPTKKEPERLLTSKEKRELEEIEAARRAKMKPNRIPKLGAIPRVGESSTKQDRNNNEGTARKLQPSTAKSNPLPYKPEQRTPEKLKKPISSNSRVTSSGSGSCSPSSSKLRDALQKQNGNSSKPSSSLNHKVPTTSKAVYIPTPKSKLPVKNTDNDYKPSSSSSSVNKNIEKYRPSTSSKEPEKSREFPPRDLHRSREFPPKDLMRSREFPPKDLIRSREFPPRDMKRPNPQQMSRKRRVIEDEESDYDSEMDDFIDDGEGDLDYSSEIKKIFGYDKSRYRDEDFDDTQMESDYRTVMREEFISKKMGLLEDLQDMKMEAEEKKRKEMKKKRKL